MSEYMDQICANKAKSHREEAAYFDRLADAADADGDKWDAAENRKKAAELRKAARNYEVSR